MKILLPVDGSAYTLRALDYIANSTELFGPRHTVMGSHGHSPLTSIVLGSVATGVLAHCKVPVVIVR